MSSSPQKASKLTTTDVAISAPLTGILTYILMLWTSSLPPTSPYKVLDNEIVISCCASALSFVGVGLISLLRHIFTLFFFVARFKITKITYSIIFDESTPDHIKDKANENLNKYKLESMSKLF